MTFPHKTERVGQIYESWLIQILDAALRIGRETVSALEECTALGPHLLTDSGRVINR
jgi:hypothetical protein